MGNMIRAGAYLAASTSTTAKPTNYTPLIIIVALFAFFYFVIIRPQRARQRRSQQMQRGIAPGERIRTTAGIYGTITAVDDNDVEVEVAPGVLIRMMRRAVLEVLPPDMPLDGMASMDGTSGSDDEDEPDEELDAQDKN